MVKVEEHLQKIKEVQKQLKHCEKGTPHFRDLYRYLKRLRKERDEVLAYLKKRKE